MTLHRRAIVPAYYDMIIIVIIILLLLLLLFLLLLLLLFLYREPVVVFDRKTLPSLNATARRTPARDGKRRPRAPRQPLVCRYRPAHVHQPLVAYWIAEPGSLAGRKTRGNRTAASFVRNAFGKTKNSIRSNNGGTVILPTSTRRW